MTWCYNAYLAEKIIKEDDTHQEKLEKFFFGRILTDEEREFQEKKKKGEL